MRLGGLQGGIGGRLDAGVPAREGGGAVRGPELIAARISGVGAHQVLDLALDRDRGRVVGVGGGVIAVGDQHPGVVAVVEADAERLRGLTIATDVPPGRTPPPHWSLIQIGRSSTVAAWHWRSLLAIVT